MNRTKGKIISSAGPTMKTFANINKIYYWVSDSNFELFKLKSPQDLINLFESYYPINCPYREELNHFERINITATQVQETSSRYVNNSSWDLYLDISFDNFYSDYFSKSKYNFKEVYSDLFGESFERNLSTNIINSNGEIVFKSTDTFEEAGKQNFSKVNEHFNNFILKLNELGGTNKFDSNAAFTVGESDTNTVGESDTNVSIFKYDDVNSNKFIENIVKFLAISMFPLISYVTKFKIRPNYYGLFYHYYEENYNIDSMYFADSIRLEYSTASNIRFEENEVEIINRFINSNIPNNNYDKCVEDLRKYRPNDLFPTCRIIDIQNNSFSSIIFFKIEMPEVVPSQPPYPTFGYCVQIMKVNNILDDDIQNNNVTVTGMVLWTANISRIFNASLPGGKEVYLPLEKAIPMFTGNTFYNGFIQPIFSSLKPVMPTFGVRDSVESVGSEVTLG
jgi:hypothetical protein